MNTSYERRAMELVSIDPYFRRIYAALEPIKAMRKLQNYIWFNMTEKFIGDAWVFAAIDAKNGIFNEPVTYSKDEIEVEEIQRVQDYFRRFNLYAELLSCSGDTPFSNYLKGISVEDFRMLLKDLRGMDAAREIQRLYKEEVIDMDLGGSKLHVFMEQLGLPYIPTVNHLNAARRGEISKGRYNISKSRARDEKYLK